MPDTPEKRAQRRLQRERKRLVIRLHNMLAFNPHMPDEENTRFVEKLREAGPEVRQMLMDKYRRLLADQEDKKRHVENRLQELELEFATLNLAVLCCEEVGDD